MDAKTAIHEILNPNGVGSYPSSKAKALSIRALEICDELGLLDDLPEPEETSEGWFFLNNRTTRETFFGDTLVAEESIDLSTVYARIWPRKAFDLEEVPKFMSELVTAYRFLKANEKHREGK